MFMKYFLKILRIKFIFEENILYKDIRIIYGLGAH